MHDKGTKIYLFPLSFLGTKNKHVLWATNDGIIVKKIKWKLIFRLKKIKGLFRYTIGLRAEVCNNLKSVQKKSGEKWPGLYFTRARSKRREKILNPLSWTKSSPHSNLIRRFCSCGQTSVLFKHHNWGWCI